MTTSKTIRLSLSPLVQFDVRFALNDAGVPRHFGFRAEGTRIPPARDTESIGAYMAADRANVRMLHWLDDVSPLKDAESGEDTPAGPEALTALFEQLPNMAGIVYEQLVLAMQAKSLGVTR